MNTIQEVNSELTKIATAQTEFLTRNGETPNAMNTNLDMNSNRITNLPAAINATDALRLIDLTGEYNVTVGIDETPVFDNITVMTSTNLTVGQLVRCKRYYSGGDLVGGLVYEIQSGVTVDGFIDHENVNGTFSILIKSNDIPLEHFGVKADGTNTAARLQIAVDYAIENRKNLIGANAYTVASEIFLKQTANEPPVREDFNTVGLHINRLIYTGATGICLKLNSPVCRVTISELEGTQPFTTVNQTIGLQIEGQGQSEHRVDWVRGFATNVLFKNAFSNSLKLGFSHDTLRALKLESANANTIFGSRIGGSFSESLIDPTSAEVGVDIDSNCSINEIHANIEYCRRSVNSIGLLDLGKNTIFVGYLESSNALNLSALGTGGRYRIVNGGNNTTAESDYNIAGRDNIVDWLNPKETVQELADGANSTLTFKINQALTSSTTTSKVEGRGYRELIQAPPVNNVLTYSNDITNAAWSKTGLGAANWGAVTSTFAVYGNASIGYNYGTRLVIPSLASTSDVYKMAQSAKSTSAGGVSFGAALRCVSGSVEIMIRILEVAAGRQTTKIVKLSANNKLTDIAAMYDKNTSPTADVQYEIQLRTSEGCTLDVFNTFLCSAPNLLRGAVSFGATASTVIPAEDGKYGLSVLNGTNVEAISSAITTSIAISEYPFSTYIISSSLNNETITLSAGVNGQIIRFKRGGTAGVGCNLNHSGGIDGNTNFAINNAYQTVTLQYSSLFGGWVII